MSCFSSESADHYIEEKIELFDKYTANVDAIVNHKPLRDGETYYPPYVGKFKDFKGKFVHFINKNYNFTTLLHIRTTRYRYKTT